MKIDSVESFAAKRRRRDWLFFPQHIYNKRQWWWERSSMRQVEVTSASFLANSMPQQHLSSNLWSFFFVVSGRPPKQCVASLWYIWNKAIIDFIFYELLILSSSISRILTPLLCALKELCQTAARKCPLKIFIFVRMTTRMGDELIITASGQCVVSNTRECLKSV